MALPHLGTAAALESLAAGGGAGGSSSPSGASGGSGPGGQTGTSGPGGTGATSGPGGTTSTTSAPAGEFAWLIEGREDGQFLGYLRLAGQLDPVSGKLVYRVPASLLEGTLFLPVVLQPAWVANHDPEVHLWSSPFQDALDLGVAAPEQWTVFPVLAPQVGLRLLVLNPITGGQGWIDMAGGGPRRRAVVAGGPCRIELTEAAWRSARTGCTGILLLSVVQ